jgi:hypothetical protein
MQDDDDHKKARSLRALKKSDGWREREESNAPRAMFDRTDVRRGVSSPGA